MNLVRILESGRADFVAALREVRDAAWKRKPWEWSALEIVEHVVIAEGRYLDWIDDGSPILPQPDTDRAMKLFFTIRDRGSRVEAPDALRPIGRYKTAEEAERAFGEVRGRAVRLVEDRGIETLHATGVRHPYFGEMSAVELLNFADGHARRHAEQIREIVED